MLLSANGMAEKSGDQLSILFVQGSVEIVPNGVGEAVKTLYTGQNLSFNNDTYLSLSENSNLILHHKGKCFQTAKPGTYPLTSVLKEHGSFLCRTHLFLSRITTPRNIVVEHHPRGENEDFKLQKYFNNSWQTIKQQYAQNEKINQNEMILAAAFFEREKEYTRVAALFGILSEISPLYRQLYQDSLLRADDNAVKQELEHLHQPEFGKSDNHALLIGIAQYRHGEWQNLDNAINDINRFEEILVGNYRFPRENIHKLKNATRLEILNSLERLAEEAGQSSNVLIYYAGHGYFERETGKGYWVPSDGASPDSKSQFIDSETVLRKTEQIPGTHTLLIADSCFSGDLINKSRTSIIPPNRYFLSLTKKPSRQIISAGGLETVFDKGEAGDHSVFAEALFGILDTPRKTPLSASELALLLRKDIKNRGQQQTPAYGRFAGLRDKNGEFFFIRKDQSPGDLGAQRSITVDQKIIPRVMVANVRTSGLESENDKLLRSLVKNSLAETKLFELLEIPDSGESVSDPQMNCDDKLCAISHAQKAGADAIITVTLHRFEKKRYFITANILSVHDGSVLLTKTIEHEGELSEMKASLRKLAFKLQEADGALDIRSNPSDAEIVLDGKTIKERSNTIIRDLEPGIHTLILQKGELWASQTIKLEPGESKNLELDLNALPVAWKIESTPTGAEVRIDGDYQGQTPLTILKPVAQYDLEISLEGYASVQEPINVLPSTNFVTYQELKKAVAVRLNITPPDVEIRIDGRMPEMESEQIWFDDINETKTLNIILGEGKHQILATHKGMSGPYKITPELKAGDEYQLDINVDLTESYLINLEYETNLMKFQAAKKRAHTALSLGTIMFLYSVDQYRQILDLEDRKEKSESDMLNAASKKESLEYYSAAKSYGNQIERRNQQMMTSAALSLVAFAAWYWFDPEPVEKPVELSVRPLIINDSSFGLGMSLKW